jgi:hypothetical protein
MDVCLRRLAISSCLVFAFLAVAKMQIRAPVIWDAAALADWATPIAALQLRPGHYTPADYYRVPSENIRTYSVYLPNKEPPGYWEALQKKKPERLVVVSTIRAKSDWIEAGARAFRELDNPFSRTDDPTLIAAIRNPKTFAGASVGSLTGLCSTIAGWCGTGRGSCTTRRSSRSKSCSTRRGSASITSERAGARQA